MSIPDQNRRRETPILIPDPILHLFGLEQIIRLPKTIHRTRFLVIEPDPRLPFPTPMQQTNRTRMQRATNPVNVIPSEPVLVPPMINGLNIPREDKQKRRQRTQLVNPLLSLQFHPVLDPLPIVPLPPPHQIHHHHPRVEITRLSGREHTVVPELVREVFSEVRVAILGRADHARVREWHAPELAYVVDDDDVGVKVYHAVDAGVQHVAEVVARGFSRACRIEEEMREDGSHESGQYPGACRVELRRHEVEEDVFRTGRVAEDGVHGGDGPSEVAGVEGHGDVNQRWVARREERVARGGNGAPRSVSVLRRLRVVEERVVCGGRKRADSEAERREEAAQNEGRNHRA
ncbi:hypothetical protein CR513_27443, partial [Mucuna pruriens]